MSNQRVECREFETLVTADAGGQAQRERDNGHLVVGPKNLSVGVEASGSCG